MHHGNSDTDDLGIPGTDAFSHAYIVWGGSAAEQAEFAEKLASAIVCQGAGQKPCMRCAHCDKALRHIHPDVITIDRNPDAREIYVDQIRALREDAVIMPNEAEKKVYIIHHAGCMNLYAQNAILKLLEEPPASAAFILITDSLAELLPTVRSRCVAHMADRRSAATRPTRQDAELFFKALTGSPLKLAEFSFTLEKIEKAEFAEFIDGAKAFLVTRMKDDINGGQAALTMDYMMKAVSVLDRANDYLEYNVSLGHIVGMICAELIQER